MSKPQRQRPDFRHDKALRIVVVVAVILLLLFLMLGS